MSFVDALYLIAELVAQVRLQYGIGQFFVRRAHTTPANSGEIDGDFIFANASCIQKSDAVGFQLFDSSNSVVVGLRNDVIPLPRFKAGLPSVQHL